MPITYTPSGLSLIGDGEEAGTWGSITNINLQILTQLTSEAATIALAGTTHTLNVTDGTVEGEGQYAVLLFGGAPSGTNTVTISPNDAKRVFIISNTSGQSVVLTQGSGGNVTVANNGKAIVYCNGGGASAAVTDLTPLNPALAAIGALTPTDGNFIVGNGTTWVAESGDTVLTSIGVTATATELNTLDGITASTAELNILDGVTADATELNYVEGVTSSIQTQLDALDTGKADKTTTITAGTGLTGGGDLSTNRTISPDIASQAEAEAGTATDKLMTPQRTAEAIAALAPEGIGVDQTWQAVTRTSGTSYQNTTGRPIMVAGECTWQFSDGFQVSTDGSTWLTLLDCTENDQSNPFSVIVPNNLYYRINGTIIRINELR